MVWLVIAACTSARDRGGPPGVGAHTDSSAPRALVEGARVPTRTATHPAGQAPPAAMPPAMPSAAESAAAFGHRYDSARATINTAALALDTLPPAARFTAPYAARFDSLRVLTRHADSLRTARDKWRKAAARKGE